MRHESQLNFCFFVLLPRCLLLCSFHLIHRVPRVTKCTRKYDCDSFFFSGCFPFLRRVQEPMKIKTNVVRSDVRSVRSFEWQFARAAYLLRPSRHKFFISTYNVRIRKLFFSAPTLLLIFKMQVMRIVGLMCCRHWCEFRSAQRTHVPCVARNEMESMVPLRYFESMGWRDLNSQKLFCILCANRHPITSHLITAFCSILDHRRIWIIIIWRIKCLFQMNATHLLLGFKS